MGVRPELTLSIGTKDNSVLESLADWTEVKTSVFNAKMTRQYLNFAEALKTDVLTSFLGENFLKSQLCLIPIDRVSSSLSLVDVMTLN